VVVVCFLLVGEWACFFFGFVCGGGGGGARWRA